MRLSGPLRIELERRLAAIARETPAQAGTRTLPRGDRIALALLFSACLLIIGALR
jgi:hypothetical protein